MHCTITLSTVYSYHTATASVKKFIEKNQKNQQNLYKISNIVNPKEQKAARHNNAGRLIKEIF